MRYPIFLGGTGRSGTTVVRDMLSRLELRVYPSEVRLCDIGEQVQHPPVEKARLLQALQQTAPDGKPYDVIFSQESVARFEQIEKLLPHMRPSAIFVYRHPMDILASMNRDAKVYPPYREGQQRFPHPTWCSSNLDNALRIRWVFRQYSLLVERSYPVISVRLEKLKERPKQEAARLARWCGRYYIPDMLEPLDVSRIVERRHQLPDKLRLEAWAVLAKTCNDFGYEY